MNKSLKIVLIAVGIFVLVSSVFFIITSSISTPVTMNLYMPKDSSTIKYSNYKAKLTLVLLNNENVFGYYGNNIQNGRNMSVSDADKLIKDGITMFSLDSLFVSIKPSKEASYKSTVDILDLMTINNVQKYSMSEMDNTEKELLKIKD